VDKIPEGVTAAERARIAEFYRDAVVNRINPAYRQLHDFVRNEYLQQTRPTVAWTALPDGAAWYAFLVKNSTTTNLTPDQIHELGLKEVARILGEMQQVKTQVCFKGDLPAFFRDLQENPNFYYTKADDLIAGYQEVKRRIDAVLPKYFSIFPRPLARMAWTWPTARERCLLRDAALAQQLCRQHPNGTARAASRWHSPKL
jgi:uncharacterized protein (DUF885 family)